MAKDPLGDNCRNLGADPSRLAALLVGCVPTVRALLGALPSGRLDADPYDIYLLRVLAADFHAPSNVRGHTGFRWPVCRH